MRFWKAIIAALVLAAPAYAQQQVPSPTNAPASVSLGHLAGWKGADPQQLADMGAPPIVPLTNYGVTTGSTPSAITTAYNQAISDCNNAVIGGIFIPSGVWNLNAEPTSILAPCTIYGEGSNSQLVFPVSASSALHRFFTIGSDSQVAARVNIHDLRLLYNNTPTANDYAIFENAGSDVRVQNLVINGAASVVKVGSSTSSVANPARSLFQNITGDFNNGLNDNCNFSVVATSNVTFQNVTMNGSGRSNTNASGALFCLVPAATWQIDTVRLLSVGLQSFTSTIAADGKPIGLHVDTTNGNVYNVALDSFTYFDHTTSHALYYTSSVGGTGKTRVHNIMGARFTPDAGDCVEFDMNSGIAVRSISLLDTRCFTRVSTIPVQILKAHDGGTTDYQEDSIIGMTIEDIGPSVSKVAGFAPNADGWMISDYKIGQGTDATSTGFQNVFDITNADLANITIGPGYWTPVATFGIFPSWTTPNLLTRQIWGQSQFVGSTSGTTTLNASAVASGVLTLPAATDTLVGRATTDTLTNKSITATGANTLAALSDLAARIYSVKDFGALCDATTDDETALAYAVAHVAAGTKMHVPSGCVGKIVDNVGLDWIIDGSLTGPNGMTGEVFQCSAANITIEGKGTIDGNRAGASSSIGIYGKASDGCSGITLSPGLHVAHTTSYGVQMLDVPYITENGINVTDTGNIGIFNNIPGSADVLGLTDTNNICDRVAEGVGIIAGCNQTHSDSGHFWLSAHITGNKTRCPLSPTGNYICQEQRFLKNAVVADNISYGAKLGISTTDSMGITYTGNSARSASTFGQEIAKDSYVAGAGNDINGFADDGVTPLTATGLEIDGTSNHVSLCGTTVVGVTTASVGIIETGTSGSKYVELCGGVLYGGGTATNAVIATDSWPINVTGFTMVGFTRAFNIVEDDGAAIANDMGNSNNLINITTPVNFSLSNGSTEAASNSFGGIGINANCNGFSQYLDHADKVLLCTGSGSPKGAFAAGIGSLYLQRDVAALWQNTTGTSSGWASVTAGAGNSAVQTPAGRLTLTSGTPVMTSDVNAAGTIYLDNFNGNQVPVYDGSNWNPLPIPGAEISVGLDATVPHWASGTVEDIIGVNNGGSLALCYPVAWSTIFSRGTGAGTTQLSQFNAGIFTNASDLTHCWGGPSGLTDYGTVLAHQGTYLGTCYATANGQTQINLSPSAGAGGSVSGGNIVGCWNMYNRVEFQSCSRDNTGSWTNSSSTWAPADASNNNRVSMIDGMGQSQPIATESVKASVSGTTAAIGINLGSTSATPGNTSTMASANRAQLPYTYVGGPVQGFRYYQAMEESVTNLSTATFAGQLVLCLQSTY